MSSKHLSIGDLSRATDTKVETIRFYEKTGLLPEPARTGGNYRAYERTHLNRLSFIRRARDLGFSLDQVRALLALSDDRSQSCEAIDVIARAHRDEVERKIKDLQALKTVLDKVLETCSCNIVADCAIIESLAPDTRQSVSL